MDMSEKDKPREIWVERRVKDRYGNTIRVERVPIDEAGLDEESFRIATEQAARGGRRDYFPRRVKPQAHPPRRLLGR
jgi:hypothetical protein